MKGPNLAGGSDALPDPLTPADCDTTGIEPPWELFISMAIEMGADPDEARAHVNASRVAWGYAL